MPICRNCKQRIQRFDKDRCPRCGIEHPFEGMSSDTIEVTTNIDTDKYGSDYRPCKKKQLLIWFLIAGFLGIPFFYIHKKKLGLICLLCNLALITAITLVFTFAVYLFVVYSLIIALVIAYLMNALIGVIIYYQPNLKDGNGEFII